MKKENECRLIYKQAFKDEDTEFEDLLFEYCFPDCKTLVKEGKTASMLFALQCDVQTQEEKLKAAYIYAVATPEALRGKGYASELIEELKAEDYDILFLRPANSSLIEFYKRLGFKEIKTDNKSPKAPKVIPTSGFKSLISATDLVDTDGDFELMYYSKCNKELQKLYFIYSME